MGLEVVDFGQLGPVLLGQGPVLCTAWRSTRLPAGPYSRAAQGGNNEQKPTSALVHKALQHNHPTPYIRICPRLQDRNGPSVLSVLSCGQNRLPSMGRPSLRFPRRR